MKVVLNLSRRLLPPVRKANAEADVEDVVAPEAVPVVEAETNALLVREKEDPRPKASVDPSLATNVDRKVTSPESARTPPSKVPAVEAVNREPDVLVTVVEPELRDTERSESATSPETSSTKDAIELTVPAVEDAETAKQEVAKEAGETNRAKVKPLKENPPPSLKAKSPSRRPRPRPPSSPRKNLRKKASPTKNT